MSAAEMIRALRGDAEPMWKMLDTLVSDGT